MGIEENNRKPAQQLQTMLLVFRKIYTSTVEGFALID